MEKLIITEGRGAINYDGKVIIPKQYAFIEILKSGVYVAYSDNTGYHFYTDQGRLELNDYVDYYRTDNDGNLIAVMLKDNMWRLIEINRFHAQIYYINNVTKAISMIENQIEDCVILKSFCGCKQVYSLKEKKVIFESNYDFEVTSKGYIVKDISGKFGFINLENELILDYKWDKIELYPDCIKVSLYKDNMRPYKSGIFSYTSECILGCKYSTLQVCDIYINDKKRTIFKVSEKTEKGIEWSILDYDTLNIFHTRDTISWVYSEYGVFTVEKKNGIIMYKFDVLNNHIRAIPVLIGDNIEFGTIYGLYGAYFVKRNGKYGLYNQYGAELIPVQYKTIDEIVKMVK